MSITENDLAGLRNGNVVSPSGEKIGSIGQIYLDDQSGEPSFATAKTGLFGLSQSFVPLQGARLQDGDLVVDYDKQTVKDAPRIDDDGSLSPAEEDQLYAYYGLGSTGTTDGYDTRTPTDAGYDTGTRTDVDEVAVTDTGATTDAGYDTGTYESSSRTNDATDRDADRDMVGSDDEAMTRSEARLNVGTQTADAGRARLRKYVVTENVAQTVPVQREEVRLEREPITDANVGGATSGADFTESESEHEVNLHEERPVVEEEAVPVERVRLETDTVTDEVPVSEELRKEEIDADIDQDQPDRRDR